MTISDRDGRWRRWMLIWWMNTRFQHSRPEMKHSDITVHSELQILRERSSPKIARTESISLCRPSSDVTITGV
jgi:hypothetical protein